MLLRFFDSALAILHISFILFFILGWIPKRTRTVHYFLVILVGVSWFILGLFYGFGYCFLTDIHWRVKMARGEVDLPFSFIKYILDKSLGYNFDKVLIDYVTLAVFISIFFLSTILFIKNYVKKSSAKN